MTLSPIRFLHNDRNLWHNIIDVADTLVAVNKRDCTDQGFCYISIWMKVKWVNYFILGHLQFDFILNKNYGAKFSNPPTARSQLLTFG